MILKPNDVQEAQAKLFAMELLLPQGHLESKFDEVIGDKEVLGFEDLDVLSEYFVVTTLIVYRRLLDLDLIE